MGVTWSAGVDNANWSLNNGLIGGSNLTDSQRQYLASMGMLSNTGQTTVQGLGHDPIKWQGELGRENFLGQLSNWEDMLNQQRMGMLNTQQQLNATGQQISDAGGRLSSDLSRTEQAIRDTNTGVQRDYENADSALRGYGRSAKRSPLTVSVRAWHRPRPRCALVDLVTRLSWTMLATRSRATQTANF